MKTTAKTFGVPNKNILRIVLATGSILLIPLIAMQLSDDVDWGVADFIIIGYLLFGSGLAFEIVRSRLNPKYRTAVAVVFAVVVALTWVELAVGIFNSPFSGS